MTAIEQGTPLILIAPHEHTQLEQGVLGEGQRLLLRRQRFVCVLGTIGFLMLAALLLAAPLLFLQGPPVLPGAVLAALGIVGLIWLGLLSRAPYQWWRISQDLRAGVVSTVEGQVRCLFRQTPGLFPFPRFSLEVGGRKLRLSQAVFAQFSHLGCYRIFYAPASGTLLGAAPLAQPITGRLDPQPVVQPEADAMVVPALTAQELAILRLLASGQSNKEIGLALSLSVNTIKMYVSQIYRKLGVQRRTEAVTCARRLGLL